MSKPGKQKSSNSSGEHRPKTPPVFFPAALSDPYADFKFTDSQFEELEKQEASSFRNSKERIF
jgi:hypothetical protein